MHWSDPSRIDLSLESRSISFENPTGARGAGGKSHAGRKGSPFKEIEAGERVVLADLEGPGTIRHIWITIPPAPPERMRAVRLEVFYDGARRALDQRPARRLLRRAARTAGPSRDRPLGDPGRARLQRLLPDAFREGAPLRARERVGWPPAPLLPDRLHADFEPATATPSSSPRRLSPRESDRAEARLRDLRGSSWSGSLPRLRRRDPRPAGRPLRLVRRGRGQDVPRRRHDPPDDLRHRPRGLRRHRLGAWVPTSRRTRASPSSSAIPRDPSVGCPT